MLTHPSPNHSARRQPVRCIVLHADASATESGTLSWMASKESGVSYHVLIGRKGEVYRLVPDDRVAWHAGKSEWKGEPMVNAFSLGLAFGNRNDGQEPYTAEARAAAVVLCAAWCRQYQLTPDAITTHALIAPGRKTDPLGFPLDGFRDAVKRALADA